MKGIAGCTGSPTTQNYTESDRNAHSSLNYVSLLAAAATSPAFHSPQIGTAMLHAYAPVLAYASPLSLLTPMYKAMYSVRAVKKDSAVAFKSETGTWEMLPASCEGGEVEVSFLSIQSLETCRRGAGLRQSGDLPLPRRREGTLPCCSGELRVHGRGASRFRQGVWISRFRGWCAACIGERVVLGQCGSLMN